MSAKCKITDRAKNGDSKASLFHEYGIFASWFELTL
jgi:hypothetical protein